MAKGVQDKWAVQEGWLGAEAVMQVAIISPMVVGGCCIEVQCVFMVTTTIWLQLWGPGPTACPPLF